MPFHALRHTRGPWPALAAAVALAALAPGLRAQGAGEGLDAYYRAAAEHFGVAASEVRILAEWNLAPDEVPVVLFLSRRGGVSADAIAALRRSGKSWADLGTQYGVHAGQLHVSLDEGIDLGPLGRAYGEFRGRPSSGWASIRLEDREVVTLVNLRFLADALNRPHAQVLSALARAGSAPAAYQDLVRGG
jgi:hypothetical protein